MTPAELSTPINKYGAGVGSQYYLAVQRPKKRKRSSDPLTIDFDVRDAQDGMMDEHELNDLAKFAASRSAIRKGLVGRGGALIASAMTPEERSARSKKGWLKRQRANPQFLSPVESAPKAQPLGRGTYAAPKPLGLAAPLDRGAVTPLKVGPDPKRDAHITRYGINWSDGNDKNAVVAAARRMSKEKWNARPKMEIPVSELNATEEFIGSKYVDRVVAGEPLREGYDPWVLIDSTGKKWIVDGHHRAAMYAALGRETMPAHVLDLRTLSKSLASRGGSLIAQAMTPEERSLRSKKGWLKRQRARATAGIASGKKKLQDAGIGDGLPSQRRVDTLSEVNTVISRLGQMSRDAKAKGKDAPNYDLCKISIPGTNLFCGSHRGKTRDTMPQLGGKPRPGSAADKLPRDKDGAVNAGDAFKEHLKKTGVSMTPRRVKASSLKASQMELVGANVGGMVRSAKEGKFDPSEEPIYVSRDGYVIDGHHRWAAVVGLDAEDGNLGGSEMNVQVLDMDIDEALKFVDDFANEFGIMPKAAKTGDSSVKKFLVDVLGEDAQFVYERSIANAQDRLVNKSVARGGALIAQSMTAAERSLRTKKGWLKRQRNRMANATPLVLAGGEKLSDRDRARLRAEQVIAAGRSVEPIITRLVSETVHEYGGRMVGLKYRLKEVDSLARKIHDKAKAKGIDIDDYARSVGDAVRYTALVDDLPPGSYRDAIKSVVGKMREQGIEVIELETHWLRGDDYNGVHLVAKMPNGSRFELQFHTSDSLKAKQKTHEIYEKIRVEGISPQERAAGIREMTRIADATPIPRGANTIGVKVRKT